MSKAREDCAAYWRFLASSVGAIYGEEWESNSSHINTSQTKSFMVLTRSMVTNNNNGDKPCTTTLERQVQTLASLTKQNHDLEE